MRAIGPRFSGFWSCEPLVTRTEAEDEEGAEEEEDETAEEEEEDEEERREEGSPPITGIPTPPLPPTRPPTS